MHKTKRGRSRILLVLLLAVSFIVLMASDPPKGEQKDLDSDGCVDCHTNAGKLITILKANEKSASSDEGGGCAVAPDRPALLNYFVKKEFIDTTHGSIGCATCHGGDITASEAVSAHADMRKPDTMCANCHGEIAQLFSTSLHATLAGQDRMLKLRAKTENNFAVLEPVRKNDCNTCHAGCGDCHINIPQAVGGGLISGHAFFKSPPMENTCAVCHGSRAGGEFMGTISESVPSDVHFQAGMTCTDCHAEPMHGDGKAYDNRWQVSGLPDCINCHKALPNDSTPVHLLEKHANASCQVCHSVAYKNCFDCHASIDEQGVYHRIPQKKTIEFKIGRNTLPGYRYDIVPLRHNPVARMAFDKFGQNLLPDFDGYPTWRTAAPHNLQRITPHYAPDIIILRIPVNPLWNVQSMGLLPES